MNPNELLVLRLRAGPLELSIVPSRMQPLILAGPVERVQRQETLKADAIRIIAEALDTLEVRTALRARGMRLVVVK